MADNGTIALWGKLKAIIDSEIDSRTRSCCRIKSMTVVSAYDPIAKTVGVQEAFGETIHIPVCGIVNKASLKAGVAVWVMVPYSSMSNAVVFMLGNGAIESDEVEKMVFMTQAEFDLKTQADFAQMFTQGSRVVYVDKGNGYFTIYEINSNGTLLNLSTNILYEKTTLLAADWTDNAQTLSVAGVLSDSGGDISLDQTASAESVQSAASALMMITSQNDGTVTVTAYGTVPSVDIPVVIRVMN